ncbi:MAG: carbon-nitrogen hydrolase family protein [Planctomycetes bacterium]|nr:carbon-nitrogen hydrolase family protein [Planctomycetota bacterium]
MIEDDLPRKVTIGTCWMRVDKVYAGLEQRLGRLVELVDAMGERAAAAGKRLDIALLPEDCNTAGYTGELDERAEPLDGPTVTALTAAARRHGTHVLVPLFTRVDGRTYNSAVLLGRDGAVLGRYDKMHGIEWPEGSGAIEHCCTPGARAATFDLDFGRVGVQICFDLLYDDGWQALEEAGAEIVLWPSAYEGVAHLGYRSWRHGYYVVSCPWRPPCGIYDPSGHQLAHAGPRDEHVLVETIDLAWRLMPWKSAKDRAKALAAKYGDRVTIHYRHHEDVWLLWSNDSAWPVDRICREEDLEPLRPYLERMRQVQDQVRGHPPLV